MNILPNNAINTGLAALIVMAGFSMAPCYTLADNETSNTQAVQNLPQSWPKTFQATGTVGNVNTGNRAIIISGTRYYYGINTRVYTTNSRYASTSDIKTGYELGFNYVEDTKRKRYLNEVWVLPSGSLTDS